MTDRIRWVLILLASAPLLIALGAPAARAAPKGMAPASMEERLILEKESVYNTIYVYEQAGYRYLKFGHNEKQYIESIYNPADQTAMPSTYTRFMTVGLAYAEALENAVVVGMGGGRTVWYLAHHVPGMTVTGVELDPEIIRIADEQFDVRAGGNLKVVERDGRIFFRQRRDERFDIIHVDAYRGPFVPFHLLTEEYYALLRSRLSPGGVVVQNIEPSTMLFDHAIATIGAVFDSVDIYPARGNYVAVAYDGPRVPQAALLEQARRRQSTYGTRYDLASLVADRSSVVPPKAPDKVLTDDFAPANYLRSVERYNRRWDEQIENGRAPDPLDALLKGQ